MSFILCSEQEKMSAPSADMLCGRPSSCRASQALDSKLGLTMVISSLQSAPEPPALDPPAVSKRTPDMQRFLDVFDVRRGVFRGGGLAPVLPSFESEKIDLC